MRVFSHIIAFLYKIVPKRKELALTFRDLKSCPCGTKDPEDIWLGSTWYNDSSYSNSKPEMWFVRCDQCLRMTENSKSESMAVWYWNIGKYRVD